MASLSTSSNSRKRSICTARSRNGSSGLRFRFDCYTLTAYDDGRYSNGVLFDIEFIEAPAFTRYLASYLNDDGYKELQTKLGANPELGDLMPGTGGFRKLRWPDARRGKGRRGGLRVIYYHFSSD